MRVEKWVLRLAEFEFTIEHIPGRENVVADALSRIPDAMPPPAPSLPAWAAAPEGEEGYGVDDPELFAVEFAVADNAGIADLEAPTLDLIREAQEEDPEYKSCNPVDPAAVLPEG